MINGKFLRSCATNILVGLIAFAIGALATLPVDAITNRFINATTTTQIAVSGFFLTIIVAFGTQWFQFRTTELRLRKERHNMLRIVGWRTYGDLIELMKMVGARYEKYQKWISSLEFSSVVNDPKLPRHDLILIDIPTVIEDHWKDFRHFTPAVCSNLAKALNFVAMYNHFGKGAPKGVDIPKDDIEEQLRRLKMAFNLLEAAIEGLQGELDSDKKLNKLQ